MIGLDPMYGLTGGGLMDPRTQGLLGLATGLLQAGGPSKMPTSFGQAASQGLLGGMQQYQAARQGQMQEIQGALATAKLKKELEAQELANNMFGDPGTLPASAPASEPGMSPGTSRVAFGVPDYATAPTAPAASPQRGPTLQQIGKLMSVDPERGKAYLEVWKAQNPDLAFQGGYAINPKTGTPIAALPQIQITPQGQAVGLTPGANGVPAVSALPGSISTFTAFQDASEGAKARREIVPVMINGRPVQMTREDAAKRLGASADSPATPATLPAPLSSTTLPADLGRPSGIGVDQTPAEKQFSTDSAGNAAKYRSGLNERVATGQDLMMRIGESEKLLKDFQAGGGEGVRVQLAQVAQAVGAPQNMVDGIARGDLGSAQAFQKIVVSQAMEALKQSMSTTGGTGAGRITQAEFQVFQKANPNLELDPRALEKIYGFAKKVHARDFSEQQGFQRWIDAGRDPAKFQPSWASQRETQMKTDALKAISGQGAGTPPNASALVNKWLQPQR